MRLILPLVMCSSLFLESSLKMVATSIILYLFFTTLVSCRHTKFSGCTIQYDPQTEQKSPVFVTNSSSNFNLVLPQRGNLRFEKRETVLVVCPGPKNSLTLTNSNTTYARCASRNQFEIIRKTVSSDELQCKKSVRADLVQTEKNCGQGKIIKIGYQVNNKWMNLIEVCYDSNKGNTLYTQHEIIGQEITSASKTNDRPGFSTVGLGANTPANVVYKQVFQKSTFNRLLKSARLAEQYINAKSYLVRGHLSPTADFLLTTWQYATYFYVNTCPQWNTINNGNWKKIENLIRKTAANSGNTFKVLTGTLDTLQLLDSNGQLVDVMLAEDKIPVPKYTWKIVTNEKTNEGIALIVINDPFMTKGARHDLLCDSICENYGWGDKTWSNVSHGMVHCCPVSDISVKVKHLLKLNIKNVLRGVN